MQTTFGGKRQTTKEELENIKKVPCYFMINKSEFILYNAVQKCSNSGFFKNQRLLILNVKNQSICYLSKIPTNTVPFQNQQQILNQQFKEILYRSEVVEKNVNRFSCREIESQNGIEIKLQNKNKKIEWMFYFDNMQLMSEWYRHISFLFTRSQQEIMNYYHQKQKQVYEESKIEAQIEVKQQKLPFQEEVKQYKKEDENLDQYDRVNIEIKPQQLSQQLQGVNPIRDVHTNEMEDKQLQDWKQKISELNDKRDKHSEFNQFQQDTPLGSFVRSKQTTNRQQQFSNKSDIPYKQPTQFINKQEQLEAQRQAMDNLQLRSMQNTVFNMIPQITAKQGQNIIHNQHVDYQQGSQRSGKIKRIRKPLDSPQINNPPLPQDNKKWNQLFYNSHKYRSSVYFQYLKECKNEAMAIIDELPLKMPTYKQSTHQGYLLKVINGIEYKIGIKPFFQESLIYQLNDINPLVTNLYSSNNHFKSQFLDIKQLFAQQPESQHPLTLYIQYKHIPVLCKALQSTSIKNKLKPRTEPVKIQQSILNRMLKGDLIITSTIDFSEEMRKNNIANLNWKYLFEQCSNRYFQAIFLSELYCSVFLNILKSQLYQLYKNFPIEQLQNPDKNMVNQVLTDCCLHLIHRLINQGLQNQSLWQLIAKQTYRHFGIKGLRQDINQNYLLYAIMHHSGLQFIDKDLTKRHNNILSNTLKIIDATQVHFLPVIECLDYTKMSIKYDKISRLIRQYPDRQKSNNLFELREEIKQQIPSQINYLIKQLHLHLSHTIPFTQNGLTSNIYSVVSSSQPSNHQYQISVSAVKWLMRKNTQEAGNLCFIKIQELLFNVGRTPMISKFYQAIAEQQFIMKQPQKGIQNFNSSIQNLITLFGAKTLEVLERKKRLSDIYQQINKKDQCLQELYECKEICLINKQTQSSLYIQILMKIAKITLTMSKIKQSTTCSLECLQHLQNKVEGLEDLQQEESAFKYLQISQLLLRSFEVSRKSQEIFGVSSLCLERCKQINNYNIFKKVLKIALFPYLKICDLRQSQILLELTEQFSSKYRQNSFTNNDLSKWQQQHKLMSSLEQKIPIYFKNLKQIYQKIHNQSLLSKFTRNMSNYLNSFQNNNNQSTHFLIEMFVIINTVGQSFIQGLLRVSYYD